VRNRIPTSIAQVKAAATKMAIAHRREATITRVKAAWRKRLLDTASASTSATALNVSDALRRLGVWAEDGEAESEEGDRPLINDFIKQALANPRVGVEGPLQLWGMGLGPPSARATLYQKEGLVQKLALRMAWRASMDAHALPRGPCVAAWPMRCRVAGHWWSTRR